LFISRLLFAAYFLEVGLILIAAPWSQFWDRNFFAKHLPMLEGFFANLFVRGAVSGIGGITALAGLAELAGIFGPRVGDGRPRVVNRER
jgi:hypothetical protein